MNNQLKERLQTIVQICLSIIEEDYEHQIEREKWAEHKIIPFNPALWNLEPETETKKELEVAFELSFTEKEISKMPKNARNYFKAKGHKVHYRKRNNGKYNCSYEIRYAKQPYNNPPISVSAATLTEAKEKFIEKLNSYTSIENAASVPTNFQEFALYWFENFHKRKVKQNTFKESMGLYNRHLKQQFEMVRIDKITPVMLQKYLDKFDDRPKTKDDLYSQLNQIFNAAVKHGIVKLNPLGMVFHKQHERIHGKAISKNDEKILLLTYADTAYQICLAVILYTGLRPCEYASASIDGKFIRTINSKRKNGKVEYKCIPISPMLRPYLSGVTELKMPHEDVLEKRLKKVLPQHKLYDMRTTFQTRCSECGIPDNVIGVLMGNSIGKLKDAYTDFSKEYLLKEIEKLNY